MTADIGAVRTGAALFTEAMSRFPSGVTIITTVERGARSGFTASAFCSLSLDPPMVLVCLARSATCHPVFARASLFAVNILGPEHAELATGFAVRGADKFRGNEFVPDDVHGLPIVADAHVYLLCRLRSRHEEGDHDIVVGEVLDVGLRPGTPVVYFDRGFHTLTPPPGEPTR